MPLAADPIRADDAERRCTQRDDRDDQPRIDAIVSRQRTSARRQISMTTKNSRPKTMPMPPTPMSCSPHVWRSSRAAALDRLDRADLLGHQHGHDEERRDVPGEADDADDDWPTMPARSEIQRRIMPTVAAMSA